MGLVFEAGNDRAEEPGASINLVISAKARGGFLGDAMNSERGGLCADRLPQKRHTDGRLNVLYADMHGGGAKPKEFNDEGDPIEENSRKIDIFSAGGRYIYSAEIKVEKDLAIRGPHFRKGKLYMGIENEDGDLKLVKYKIDIPKNPLEK